MSRDRTVRKWNGVVYPALGVLATLLVIGSCSREPAMPTWSYDQFINSVESGQVEKVNLNSDRTQAIVTTSSGQQVTVDVSSSSSDPALFTVLEQNDVDIEVSSPDDVIFNRLGLVWGVMVITSLASFLFWIWVLIDCATKEASEGSTKLVWVVIILFANLIGALMYFFVRRPQRINELGQ